VAGPGLAGSAETGVGAGATAFSISGAGPSANAGGDRDKAIRTGVKTLCGPFRTLERREPPGSACQFI